MRLIGGIAQNCGQRLDNVSQTHLVLASDKLVLEKNLEGPQKCSFNSLGLFSFLF